MLFHLQRNYSHNDTAEVPRFMLELPRFYHLKGRKTTLQYVFLKLHIFIFYIL